MMKKVITYLKTLMIEKTSLDQLKAFYLRFKFTAPI
ncbi:unknown [[Mannheimia] succiniciproducens MBEL55E]|uniref:Uncharacterized protein n=1 Tax=Mannheimia succiniciproducens (strain KCTC 0769BP / MBEL55E) TaxID=221988 RepID=Q65W86_MANSM|nr:unknown [[Mannheimia] succiniciproducens MBEL55E]